MAMETWCFVAIVRADGSFIVEVKNLWSKKLSVEKLRDFTKFLSWGGGELSVKLSGKDIPTLSFRGRISSTDHENLYALLSRIADTLSDIQIRSGFTMVQLSLSDLRGSMGELNFFHDILTGNDMQLYAKDAPPLKIDVPLSKVFGYFEFHVGEFFYFVLFEALVTDSSTEQDGIRVDCGNRILLDCFVGDSVEEVHGQFD